MQVLFAPTPRAVGAYKSVSRRKVDSLGDVMLVVACRLGFPAGLWSSTFPRFRVLDSAGGLYWWIGCLGGRVCWLLL